MGARPRVTVLLATHNGMPWLPEQVATILNQDGVDVELIISDDASADGSWAWLTDVAAGDPRITLLAHGEPSGRAGANFYRLLREVDVSSRELIAFADQDDVWLPGKLATQAATLRAGGFDGVSSDVTAVYDDGRRVAIRKSYPQRRFDFLLESAGPGCTFVITPRLAAEVQRLLRDEASPAADADLHDWLVYAVCRARGWSWLIQDTPWVDYRQHGANALGANRGAAAARDRFRRIRRSWHRDEAVKLVEVAASVAPPSALAEFAQLRELLTDNGLGARLRLAARAGELRRRPRDRWLIRGLVATGLW